MPDLIDFLATCWRVLRDAVQGLMRAFVNLGLLAAPARQPSPDLARYRSKRRMR